MDAELRAHWEDHVHAVTQYHFSRAFEVAEEYINTLAGLMVLFAVVLAGANLCIVAFNATSGYRVNMIDPFHYHNKNETEDYCVKSAVLRIRLIMGEQIAFALGLLVASDILDTVLKPSHAYQLLDVVKMGFVTILRTGLAYFLAREIKELEVDTARRLEQRRSEQKSAGEQQQERSPSPPIEVSVRRAERAATRTHKSTQVSELRASQSHPHRRRDNVIEHDQSDGSDSQEVVEEIKPTAMRLRQRPQKKRP